MGHGGHGAHRLGRVESVSCGDAIGQLRFLAKDVEIARDDERPAIQ
jgi:hypothetical protein